MNSMYRQRLINCVSAMVIILTANFLLLSPFLAFAQSSGANEVPEPAAEDLVEPASEGLVDPAAEDLVAPASEDAVEAAPIYGKSMVDKNGRCTAEAEAKGECIECLGSEPIPPWSDEAERERAHNMDCYILRTQSWTEQQNNPVDDAQSLQDTSYSCEPGSAACPFQSQSPQLQGTETGIPGLTTGQNPLSTSDQSFFQNPSSNLTGQFAGQSVTSVISTLNAQLANLQQLANLAGFAANSGISQSLSLLNTALSLLNQLYLGNSLGTFTDSTGFSTVNTFEPTQNSYANPQVSGKSLDNIDLETLSVLDYITQRVDHPIVVTSAYRDETYNASVGGASQSQHTQGKALDLSTSGLSTQQRIHLVSVILSHPSVNGFGYYTGDHSVHFDTRPVRVGKGYWGPDYSYTSFDQGAHFGLIDREIVDLVYAWSGS